MGWCLYIDDGGASLMVPALEREEERRVDQTRLPGAQPMCCFHCCVVVVAVGREKKEVSKHDTHRPTTYS